MSASTWDQREQRILDAVNEAREKGEDPNRAARAVVPDLSDEVYREAVASLIKGRYLEGKTQRDGANRISLLSIERLGPRGLQAVGRWPGRRSTTSAAEEETRSQAPDDAIGDKRRRVFLVSGRNTAAATAMTHLLESADLRVVEWEQARAATGKTNPYIGEILTAGMDMARGVVVLFTADDMAVLDPRLWNDGDPSYEHELSDRARQNVVFEAGMALGRDENRVVMVEFGILPGFSDLAGRHSVRMDVSAPRRKDILDRLVTAGCTVDFSGTRWTEAGDFTGAALPPVKYTLEPAGEKGSSTSAPESGVPEAPSSSPGQRITSSPLSMLQPNSYLDSGPTGHADFLIRCAVLLPLVWSRPASSGETLSSIRGEQRENALADLLTQSELTSWLEQQRGPFHLNDLGTWTQHGSNVGDFTRLARAPSNESGGPSPVSLTCDVTTGRVTTPGDPAQLHPAIELVADIRYRLLDFDEQRQHLLAEHPSPEQAHARLTVLELFDALITCMSACDVAVAAYALTMPDADVPRDGQLASWVTSRANLEDVVDVTGTRVVPGSAMNSQHGEFRRLPLAEPATQMAPLQSRRSVARSFIAEWLERSGRRGVDGLLAQLSS